MPELEFRVLGVEPVAHGLTPLLHFNLEVSCRPGSERVQALVLQAQVQLQTPQRPYSPRERARLIEIFGPPERWSQTLRNRLWTTTQATVGAFIGRVETVLPVPCSCDHNLLATKYFYALEDGDVPLLFLFSGSIFYLNADGRLQVQPISWDKECIYRLSLSVWQAMIQHHFPNTAWLSLPRELFDQLHTYKRQKGLATGEEAVRSLLQEQEAKPAPGPGALLQTPQPEGIAA